MKTRFGLFSVLAWTVAAAGCNIVLGLDDYQAPPVGQGCEAGAQQPCIYSGPAATENVGLCRAAVQTCKADGSGWGACEGEVLPAAAEDCATPGDDDCDGYVNEADECACAPGMMMPCYAGPAGTEGIGECKAGMQTCKSDGSGYGECVGEVQPTAENCATLEDEDCDGKTFDDADDGCVCASGTTTACYTGPAGTQDVGICAAGTWTCNADGLGYGACSGEITPAPADDCNVVGDEDCSGSGCSDHRFSAAFGNVADSYPNGITTDPSGNVVMVGGYYGSIQFDPNAPALAAVGDTDLFIAKFDNNGQHLWSKRFGDGNEQTATSVVTDAAGNIYVTGYFTGTLDFGGGYVLSDLVTKYDGFIAKFSPSGTLLWANQYGGGNNERFWSITLDNAGNIIITGWNSGGIGGNDLWLVKYSPAGVTLWYKLVNQGGNHLGIGVGTDASNSIFLTGYMDAAMTIDGIDYGPAGGGNDVFLMKFDSAGKVVWFKAFGDAASQAVNGLAVDSAGNAIISGTKNGAMNFGGGVLGTLGGEDVFVAKFDPAGVYVAAKQFGGSSNQKGTRVAADKNGNIILTGEFAGSISFGGGSLTAAGALGTTDMFLAKFDDKLQHIWSKRFGDGNSPQVGYCVAAGPDGKVFLAGYGANSVDFGGGACAGGGAVDIFFAGFEP